MEAQKVIADFLAQSFKILSKEVRLCLLQFCQAENPNTVAGMPDDFVSYVKEYPDFGFDFWQDLAPNQRESYFTKRSQVYQFLSSSVALQTLQERLESCLAIYQEDPVVYLLTAYVLVLSDFRLKNKEKLNQLQLLLAKGCENQQWLYIREYISFVLLAQTKGQQARPILLEKAVYFYQFQPQELPQALYQLTRGYVAYLVSNYEVARRSWYEYDKMYRNVLNSREEEFIKPRRTEKKPVTATAETEGSNWQTHWLWLLFVIYILLKAIFL